MAIRKKDLKTLRTIAAHRRRLQVTNARFRGPREDAREYPFSENVLFAWAGGHRAPELSYESPDVPMISEGIKELRGCFLQLHTETGEIAKPRVFARACPQRRRRNKES